MQHGPIAPEIHLRLALPLGSLRLEAERTPDFHGRGDHPSRRPNNNGKVQGQENIARVEAGGGGQRRADVGVSVAARERGRLRDSGGAPFVKWRGTALRVRGCGSQKLHRDSAYPTFLNPQRFVETRPARAHDSRRLWQRYIQNDFALEASKASNFLLTGPPHIPPSVATHLLFAGSAFSSCRSPTALHRCCFCCWLLVGTTCESPPSGSRARVFLSRSPRRACCSRCSSSSCCCCCCCCCCCSCSRKYRCRRR